jgi:myo-inositol catabolism protein IolC
VWPEARRLVLRQRLAAWLAGELADDEEADTVIHQLVGLANEWMRQRTTVAGSAFPNGDGQ